MQNIRSSELQALHLSHAGCTHSILFLFSLTHCLFLQVAFSFHLFLLCISYWYTLEACAVWAVFLQSVDAALELLGGLVAAPLLFLRLTCCGSSAGLLPKICVITSSSCWEEIFNSLSFSAEDFCFFPSFSPRLLDTFLHLAFFPVLR